MAILFLLEQSQTLPIVLPKDFKLKCSIADSTTFDERICQIASLQFQKVNEISRYYKAYVQIKFRLYAKFEQNRLLNFDLESHLGYFKNMKKTTCVGRSARPGERNCNPGQVHWTWHELHRPTIQPAHLRHGICYRTPVHRTNFQSPEHYNMLLYT